jgi:hypothetical protein
VNLFFEASTRTRLSFELAEKRLSADTLGITTVGSSVSKGETLLDTARTLEAMAPDMIVIRHAASGAPHLLARACHASARHCVDESARLLRDSREPFVRSCWRDQKDRVELVLKHILSPRLCFLGNEICHEHSVDPGLFRCRGEWFRAELQERIEITEEHDGYIDVLPDVSRAGKRVVHGHAIA